MLPYDPTILLPPVNAKRAGGYRLKILRGINTLSLKKLNNAQKITSKY